MIELLKLIAEDKSGGVGFFVAFLVVSACTFVYLFFAGAAHLVRAIRGK